MMNAPTVSAILLVLTLASCKNKPAKEAPRQETPQALTDKSSAYEVISKRAYDDLVEELYRELVSKDEELKKLEDKIGRLNEGKDDTTALFLKFNVKNLSYFGSANRLVADIKDSVLSDRIKLLVANQFKKYQAQIVPHNNLLKDIETNQLSLGDLHNALKIVRTLPVIDRFQQESLPGTKPLQGYIQQQEQAIRLADTLTRK